MTHNECTAELTICIMAYNEQEAIEKTVNNIHSYLTELNIAFELIIINDGSDDGTELIAAELAANLPNTRIINHQINKGLGYVYHSAFTHASGKFLSLMPADGQFPPQSIGMLLDQAKSSNSDLILGYFDSSKRPAIGRFFSSAEKLFYRILFGKMPKFQGLILVKVAKLRELKFFSIGRGWVILFEMIIKARDAKWKIANAETPFNDRESGNSKVYNFSTILNNIFLGFQLKFGLIKEAFNRE